MAKVITTELQHSGASGANITMDGSKNVTCENNLQVDGNLTVTGTIPAAKLTGALPAISGASLTGISSQDTLSNRNLMINGDMRISQRGAYTGQGTSGKYGTDGWELKGQASGMVHSFIHQDTGMNEFPKCLRMDCTTAATGAVTEVKLTQMIESQDLGRFKFGTSSAESITVSFWCRSNQASTFVVWMHRDDGGRHNGKTFAISAADTWEKKTITFSPDTSGTPANDNTRGFQISWILNSGTGYTSGTSPNGTWEAITDVNRYVGLTATIGGNTNDYFDLTGVQVETGTTATDFEHRTYGDELQRCLRYYWQDNVGNTTHAFFFFSYVSSHKRLIIHWPVPMRTAPTRTLVVNTGSPTASVNSIYQGNWYVGSTYSDTQHYVGESIICDAEL